MSKKKNIVLMLVISLSIMLSIVGCSSQNTGDETATTDNTFVEVNDAQDVSGNDKDSADTNMNIKEVEAALTTLSYDSFEGKQEWRNQVLLGDGQILSFSDSNALCYTNLETGVSLPICQNPECQHNNFDACSAIFAESYGIYFAHCYNNKIYVVGSSPNSIVIYRCDMDGKNHEKVAYETVSLDMFVEDYYVYDSCLYMMVSVEDQDKKILSEDESMYVLSDTYMYCYDFDTNEIKQLHPFNEDAYAVSAGFRYEIDGALYYDCVETYLEDGAEDKDVIEESHIQYVYKICAFDIATGEVSDVEGYQVGDYLGRRDDIYYFAEQDDEYSLTGDIRIENSKDGTQRIIHIDKIEGQSEFDYAVRLLGDGFVVHEYPSYEDGEETGNMIFCDENGKETFVVENCSLYIVGEHEGVYLLGYESYEASITAYISKEDIRIEDIKERNRKIKYLY